MSRKESPPKERDEKIKEKEQKTSIKKVKEPEDWIAEIIPKKTKTKASKQTREDLSDIAVNRIPGIGPAIAEKLMTSGYITLASVAHASPNELV
ncbi:MAG: helix-hairpin-helix domain-containing protein, partial [Candidatus Heimdallarchaeaceae archaeon]